MAPILLHGTNFIKLIDPDIAVFVRGKAQRKADFSFEKKNSTMLLTNTFSTDRKL